MKENNQQDTQNLNNRRNTENQIYIKRKNKGDTPNGNSIGDRQNQMHNG